MTKKEIRRLIADMDAGNITQQEVINEVRAWASPPSMTRLEYVKENYTYDPMSGQIFNRKRGVALPGLTIHTGGVSSPVTRLRAKWFLIVGDDPREVREDRFGIYAIYDHDENLHRIEDRTPADKQHLLMKPLRLA